MFGKKKEIKETLEALVSSSNGRKVYVRNMPYYEMIQSSVVEIKIKGTN